jgi:penicillin-binding protein 2
LFATQDGLGAERVPVATATPPTQVIKNPADWKAVEEGMRGAVYGDHGTARGLAAGFPWTIAGKTGTVEKFSRTSNEWDTRASNAELAARHRALFVCFTPAEAPRIAVAVILESGAWGGTDAAPIARKMLDTWIASQPDAPPVTPLPASYFLRGAAPPPAAPKQGASPDAPAEDDAQEGTP